MFRQWGIALLRAHIKMRIRCGREFANLTLDRFKPAEMQIYAILYGISNVFLVGIQHAPLINIMEIDFLYVKFAILVKN